MLVSTLPLEGLKSPSNRSSPKFIELFVRLKTELFADEGVSSHVGLLVSADVGTCRTQSGVSEETEDWQ